jgi:hypothetical protein
VLHRPTRIVRIADDGPWIGETQYCPRCRPLELANALEAGPCRVPGMLGFQSHAVRINTRRLTVTRPLSVIVAQPFQCSSTETMEELCASASVWEPDTETLPRDSRA